AVGKRYALLQRLGEMSEPFGKNQTGSSAMAYKRNPMRSERMCSLGRYLMLMPAHADFTAGTQWFERTLDDSAIRRITIPESFLAADAVLNLYLNVSEGMNVHPKVIERNLADQLPFMATENVLMAAVQKGGDRQELHELIRQHSIAAADAMRNEGADNDLLDRLARDDRIPLDAAEIADIVDVRQFIGRAPEQVTEFLDTEVAPVLDTARAEGFLGLRSDVNV
ncbi:MAG: adenylosuccinate lyase, partial [Candidatus Hydrogenedentes bacterium]|nr:adenylosuccinate lyase [Candidatus Hydrogenedentota bacterium]